MSVDLADFLETKLIKGPAKGAVIWVKRRQKARFFGPDKLQNHTNEGKENEKKK